MAIQEDTTNSKQQTIFGATNTTVLGVVWNYYAATTKLVTGLDMTIDMFLRIDVFFSKNVTLGWATAYRQSTVAQEDLYKSWNSFCETFSTVSDSNQALIGRADAVITTRNSSVGSEISVVGDVQQDIGTSRRTVGDEEVKAVMSKLVAAVDARMEVGANALTVDNIGGHQRGFCFLGEE